MSRDVHGPPATGPDREPPPLSADAFETSRLLLELVHAAQPSREGPGSGGPGATVDVEGRVHTAHAVRAAIHVYQHGERTVGELAAGLGVSYGWASRVVSELEATGMVERRSDESDRRVVRVTLTPAAIGMVERAYRWRGEAVERALAGLDEGGRLAVATFLRRVTEELLQGGAQARAHPDPEHPAPVGDAMPAATPPDA